MKVLEHDASASSESEQPEGECYDGLSGDIYSDWADEVTEACDRARDRDNGFIEIREMTDNHHYTIESPEACTDEEWQVVATRQAENERQLFADVFGAFACNRYGFGGDLPMKIYELCRAELFDGEDVPDVLDSVSRAYEDGDRDEPWPNRNEEDYTHGWESALDKISWFLTNAPAASELSRERLLDRLEDMVASLQPGIDIGPDWISKSTFRSFEGWLQLVPAL